ncbi:MAG: YitT family protein [Erysipelothrix sp.]|nr:YitT family protein [Erysipelothrix sp.]
MMKLIKKHYKSTFMIVFGNIILAFGVSFLILPNQILTGGIFGVAIALNPILPNIDTNYIAYTMIAITFILGAVFLGRSFAVKTVLSSIIYPIFLEMFRYFPITITSDPLLASLYGGLITGVALGIVFRAKGSTGGMDVFPLIMKAKFNVKPATGIILVDGLTVLLGLSTLGAEHVLFGLISVFASSYTIEKVIMLGSESAKCTYILSDKLAIINDRIHQELERGTTFIKAEGGYSRDSRDMLMCVLTVEQYPILKSIVYEEDESAFLIVSDSHEVLGEGFTYGHRV